VADDGFMRGHQVSRVLGIAVPLCIFLVWWGLWGDPGKVTSESEVSAVVIKDEGRTCLVRVASGQQVRVLKPRNAHEGTKLRMRRTEYSNGELRFEPMATLAPDGAE
jgi:hypothetical protein